MNILFVVSHLRKGGPVDVVYNICRQMIQRTSSHVYIVTLRKETENSKWTDFENLGIEITSLGYSYLACELLSRKISNDIERLVRQKQIDIIHSHTYHPVIVCSHIQGVKKVSTLHNRATEDFINVYGKIMGNLMVARYFKALRRFDANIAVSQSAVELYQQYIPQVALVNNGVDTQKFVPLDDELRLTSREKLGLSPAAKILISTDRIEKEKRYVELIEWFNRQTDNNLVLLILGDGRLLSVCKERAANNPNVVFTGRVDNVSDYLQCADFYISNSQSEGMSMAVCEGMACGLFPILSCIPSHQDVAQGVNGVLFNKLDDIPIDAIVSFQYSRTTLHEYIDCNFSIQSMGNGYFRIYRELLN